MSKNNNWESELGQVEVKDKAGKKIIGQQEVDIKKEAKDYLKNKNSISDKEFNLLSNDIITSLYNIDANSIILNDKVDVTLLRKNFENVEKIVLSKSKKDLKILKARINKDGKYTPTEIKEFRDFIIANNDKSIFAEELQNNQDVIDWVNSEIKDSNIRHLNRKGEKDLIDNLIKVISKKHSQFDVKVLEGKNYVEKGIYLVKYMLNKLGYTGLSSGQIAVNENFDIDFFYSLVNYQNESLKYKGKVLKEVAVDENQGGMPDGIANGRTLRALAEELDIPLVQNLYSKKPRDGVGATNIDNNEEVKKYSVTMSSAELKNTVNDKLNNLDPNLKSKVEKIMISGQPYQLLWSLLLTEGKYFGNEKNYEGLSGYFKFWGRHIDKSNVYHGSAMESLFKNNLKFYQNGLMKLSQAIISGDKTKIEKITTNLENIQKRLPEDITDVISNFGLIPGSNESGYKKQQMKNDIKKYQARFDKGETFAVYEFMSKVLKNDIYADGVVFAGFDIKASKASIGNMLMKEGNESKIDNFFKGKQFTIFGKSLAMPNSINYGKIIIKARQDSMEGLKTIDEGYVLQKIITEVLLKSENEIKKATAGTKDTELINLFYKNKGFVAELSKHWSSYAVKGAMAGALAYGSGGVASGILSKLGLGSLTGVGGFVTDVVAQTAVFTPTMVIGTGIMSGRTLGESADPLTKPRTWLESAAMLGVFNGVARGLGAIRGSKALSGVEATRGGRYMLNSVTFGAEVGALVGVNTLIFNGEFTAEEIINAIMFVAMGKGFGKVPKVKVEKTGDDITIRTIGTIYPSESKGFANVKTIDGKIFTQDRAVIDNMKPNEIYRYTPDGKNYFNISKADVPDFIRIQKVNKNGKSLEQNKIMKVNVFMKEVSVPEMSNRSISRIKRQEEGELKPEDIKMEWNSETKTYEIRGPNGEKFERPNGNSFDMLSPVGNSIPSVITKPQLQEVRDLIKSGSKDIKIIRLAESKVVIETGKISEEGITTEARLKTINEQISKKANLNKKIETLETKNAKLSKELENIEIKLKELEKVSDKAKDDKLENSTKLNAQKESIKTQIENNNKEISNSKAELDMFPEGTNLTQEKVKLIIKMNREAKINENNEKIKELEESPGMTGATRSEIEAFRLENSVNIRKLKAENEQLLKKIAKSTKTEVGESSNIKIDNKTEPEINSRTQELEDLIEPKERQNLTKETDTSNRELSSFKQGKIRIQQIREWINNNPKKAAAIRGAGIIIAIGTTYYMLKKDEDDNLVITPQEDIPEGVIPTVISGGQDQEEPVVSQSENNEEKDSSQEQTISSPKERRSSSELYDLSVEKEQEDGKKGEAEVLVNNLNIRNADGKIVGKLNKKSQDKVVLTGKYKTSNGVKFVEIEGGNYVAEGKGGKPYLAISNKSEDGQKDLKSDQDDNKEDSILTSEAIS